MSFSKKFLLFLAIRATTIAGKFEDNQVIKVATAGALHDLAEKKYIQNRDANHHGSIPPFIGMIFHASRANLIATLQEIVTNYQNIDIICEAFDYLKSRNIFNLDIIYGYNHKNNLESEKAKKMLRYIFAELLKYLENKENLETIPKKFNNIRISFPIEKNIHQELNVITCLLFLAKSQINPDLDCYSKTYLIKTILELINKNTNDYDITFDSCEIFAQNLGISIEDESWEDM
jgi:hypothetical protein